MATTTSVWRESVQSPQHLRMNLIYIVCPVLVNSSPWLNIAPAFHSEKLAMVYLLQAIRKAFFRPLNFCHTWASASVAIEAATLPVFWCPSFPSGDSWAIHTWNASFFLMASFTAGVHQCIVGCHPDTLHSGFELGPVEFHIPNPSWGCAKIVLEVGVENKMERSLW